MKKTKTLKLLALGGTLGLVSSIPIVATACSTSSTDQDSNINGGDINNPNTVKKLELNDTIANSIKIGKSFTDLFNSNVNDGLDFNSMNQKLLELMNQDENFKRNLIKDYDNLTTSDKNTLIFTNLKSDTTDEAWGTKEGWDLSVSSLFSNTIYKHETKDKFSISSISDFKSQLSSIINDVMKKSLDASRVDVNKYENFKLGDGVLKLAQDNQYSSGIANSYFWIHVVGELKPENYQTQNNGSNGQSVTIKQHDLDLKIPVSIVNYAPKNAKISASVANTEVQPILDQYFFVEYTSGINTTGSIFLDTQNVVGITGDDNYKVSSVGVQVSGSDLTAKGVASSLGWVNGEVTNESLVTNLNSVKVGESLKIFNANFTSMSITDISATTEGNVRDCELSLVATPKDGFHWNDGTTDTRTLKINIKVILNSIVA